MIESCVVISDWSTDLTVIQRTRCAASVAKNLAVGRKVMRVMFAGSSDAESRHVDRSKSGITDQFAVCMAC